MRKGQAAIGEGPSLRYKLSGNGHERHCESLFEADFFPVASAQAIPA